MTAESSKVNGYVITGTLEGNLNASKVTAYVITGTFPDPPVTPPSGNSNMLMVF